MDDRELNRLLREWTAPDAPPHVRPRRAQGHGCTGWSPARFAYRSPSPSPRCCWPRCGSSRGGLAHRRPNIRATAIRRAGEIRVDRSSRGVRRGARGVELPARRLSAGTSASGSHPGVRCGWADADRHQSPAGPDRARGRHVLRTAGALHTSFSSANPDTPVRAVAFLVVPSGSPLTERATTRREP